MRVRIVHGSERQRLSGACVLVSDGRFRPEGSPFLNNRQNLRVESAAVGVRNWLESLGQHRRDRTGCRSGERQPLRFLHTEGYPISSPSAPPYSREMPGTHRGLRSLYTLVSMPTHRWQCEFHLETLLRAGTSALFLFCLVSSAPVREGLDSTDRSTSFP